MGKLVEFGTQPFAYSPAARTSRKGVFFKNKWRKWLTVISSFEITTTTLGVYEAGIFLQNEIKNTSLNMLSSTITQLKKGVFLVIVVLAQHRLNIALTGKTTLYKLRSGEI